MKRATAPSAQDTDTAIQRITERDEYRAALAPVREVERALDERQRALASMLARRRGEKSKRSAAEKAAALIAGGRLASVPSDNDLENVHEEIALLRRALIEKHEILDRVTSELSHAECEAVRPMFDACMRDALVAMRQLALAFNGAAQLAATLHKAGYHPSSVVLPHLIPSGAALLGDPNSPASEAWYFARALQGRGIL